MSQFALTINFSQHETVFPLMDAINNVLAEYEASGPPAQPKVQAGVVTLDTVQPVASNGNGNGYPPRQPGDPAPVIRDPESPVTEKQLSAVGAISRKKKIADALLFDWIDTNLRQGINLDDLTKGEASKLINALDAGEVNASVVPF